MIFLKNLNLFFFCKQKYDNRRVNDTQYHTPSSPCPPPLFWIINAALMEREVFESKMGRFNTKLFAGLEMMASRTKVAVDTLIIMVTKKREKMVVIGIDVTNWYKSFYIRMYLLFIETSYRVYDIYQHVCIISIYSDW